jgi:hypothetical protein
LIKQLVNGITIYCSGLNEELDMAAVDYLERVLNELFLEVFLHMKRKKRPLRGLGMGRRYLERRNFEMKA